MALNEQGRIVRLPNNQVAGLNNIFKVSAQLEQEMERPPSPEDLAEAMGMTPERIIDALGNYGQQVSMDAPFVAGEEKSLLDVLENGEAAVDSNLIHDSLVTEVQLSMVTLAEREREVLTMLFGLGGTMIYSLDEVSDRMALTTERVRQIKEKALERLRLHSKSTILQSYL